jgi:hypothetical protein
MILFRLHLFGQVIPSAFPHLFLVVSLKQTEVSDVLSSSITALMMEAV